VHLVNLLAALNFANVFKKIKKRVENKKNVKKRKKTFLRICFTQPPGWSTTKPLTEMTTLAVNIKTRRNLCILCDCSQLATCDAV